MNLTSSLKSDLAATSCLYDAVFWYIRKTPYSPIEEAFRAIRLCVITYQSPWVILSAENLGKVKQKKTHFFFEESELQKERKSERQRDKDKGRD